MTTPGNQSQRQEWVERLSRLYTAVVCDILDSLGYRQQAFHPRIRPLWPEARCAGFALTVQTAPARERDPAHPYAGELAAVDALQPDDVLVVSPCQWSFWGELLSTAARYRGCRGVILDGPTRDSRTIQQMEFPVFHVGCHPADSRGRLEVIAYNVPICCGEVLVYPRDLILADHDGIVAIPQCIAEEVLRRAEEKVSGENQVRKALAAGMSVSEAFQRFGIL
ncbi:MAG: demethylmenaquinone methyltransferase [Gemmataceae bacterium]|jgi:4-hydroxy-4-methyl-2-oxoglutarate aldolase|nr:MAG: demethylmenaquinone methyltransferase [Gemmataceae bacterium]